MRCPGCATPSYEGFGRVKESLSRKLEPRSDPFRVTVCKYGEERETPPEWRRQRERFNDRPLHC